MFTRTAVVGVLVIGLVACGDDGPPGAEPRATTTTAPTAAGLAATRVTASTVAAPAGAPPCTLDLLQFTAGDAVVVIRNTGSIECEVDVSASPNRDPLMEPSIWLHPGGEGELAVEPSDLGCAQPSTIDSVDLVVNGEPMTAPVDLPSACHAALTAIYTAD